MGYSFYLKKENFKFSSAHFTIFNEIHSEALHGHNYRVGVHLRTSNSQLKNEMICDFNIVKKLIRSICDILDEKVLIPKNSPYLTIKNDDLFPAHTHVVYNSKHYLFPTADVLMMDCQNITSEALAHFMAHKAAPELKPFFDQIQISIEETRGQAASFAMALK